MKKHGGIAWHSPIFCIETMVFRLDTSEYQSQYSDLLICIDQTPFKVAGQANSADMKKTGEPFEKGMWTRPGSSYARWQRLARAHCSSLGLCREGEEWRPLKRLAWAIGLTVPTISSPLWNSRDEADEEHPALTSLCERSQALTVNARNPGGAE